MIPTPSMAVSKTVSLLLFALALPACESAAEKCATLRGAAAQAWGSYEGDLQKEREALQAALAGAKKKLEGEITQRHEAEARAHADKLHGTETSTAWYRTFLATTKALCSKDPECLELKVQLTEGEVKLADLGRRIDAVHAAQAAIGGEAKAARAAADAVPEDARAAFEPARAVSAEASTVCADAEP